MVIAVVSILIGAGIAIGPEIVTLLLRLRPRRVTSQPVGALLTDDERYKQEITCLREALEELRRRNLALIGENDRLRLIVETPSPDVFSDKPGAAAPNVVPAWGTPQTRPPAPRRRPRARPRYAVTWGEWCKVCMSVAKQPHDHERQPYTCAVCLEETSTPHTHYVKSPDEVRTFTDIVRAARAAVEEPELSSLPEVPPLAHKMHVNVTLEPWDGDYNDGRVRALATAIKVAVAASRRMVPDSLRLDGEIRTYAGAKRQMWTFMAVDKA